MSLNNKILLLTLSMIFHGALISMQEEGIYEQQVRISQFIHEKDHNPKLMQLVGQWLTQKRQAVPDYERWNIIVNFITSVGLCRCDCLAQHMTFAIKDAIKQVAHNLQLGQDCSQLLVDRAQEAIATTTHEWNKAKMEQDLQLLTL